MATIKGKDAVSRFLAAAPVVLASKVLIGAGRAAAKVVAEEAKVRVISSEVREAIKVSVKREEGRVIAKVQVKGPGAYLAPWLEYGTSPHFISVDPRRSQGRTASRINKLDRNAAKDGDAGPGESLRINGKFVGETVHHPGARPHPFLRVSLDTKKGEAIGAAQAYVNAQVARIKSAGLAAAQAGEDEA